MNILASSLSTLVPSLVETQVKCRGSTSSRPVRAVKLPSAAPLLFTFPLPDIRHNNHYMFVFPTLIFIDECKSMREECIDTPERISDKSISSDWTPMLLLKAFLQEDPLTSRSNRTGSNGDPYRPYLNREDHDKKHFISLKRSLLHAQKKTV